VRPIPVGRLVVPVTRDAPRHAPVGAEDSIIADVEARQHAALRTAATAALNDIMQVDAHEPPTDPAGGNTPRSLQIWGADAERGRVLVDGAAVNAPLHLGAILPPVDPSMLAQTSLRTGGAPAQYDGGTTFIVDHRTRAPRADRLRGWGEASLLVSRLGVEMPIGQHGGLMFGARRVNDEAVDALIDQSFDYEYHDAIGRAALRTGTAGAIDATALVTRETISIPRDQGIDHAAWHNAAAALAWDPDTDATGIRARASISRGVVDLPLLSAPDGHMAASLDRLALTAAHDWSTRNIDVDAGIELEHLRLARHSEASSDPAAPELRGPVACTPSLPCADAAATTAAAFTDVHWNAAPRFAIDAGLRTAWDTHAGRVHVLPRLALTWIADEATTATLSAGRYSQVGVLESLEAPQPFVASRLLTSTRLATQVELALAHRADRFALEARAFVRSASTSDDHAARDPDVVPGAELAWALVVGRNSLWGGYSLLARRTIAPDSIDGLQHLVFMGVGTGTGPLHLGLSGIYGAGVPLTSIVLDRPSVMGFAPTISDAPTTSDTPTTPPEQGPYVRLDATLTGEWMASIAGRDVHIAPYAKLINAVSRRGALFYFREGGTAELQPLSALPTMPVVGVRWTF
jgi:hypothetical protein